MVNDFGSNRIDFLETLGAFSKEQVKDLIFPTQIQREGEEQQYRAADIYLMRLPNSKSAMKKAPYVLHQLITARDQQNPGERISSRAQVRSIFCVYDHDEQEGSLMLLNLAERLRIALLKTVVIGKRYQLDLQEGLELLIYPDDTAPFYAGEMVSTWNIPSIEREVRQWL